jgi:prepilin-type N-terminal cleavage/methylation domain-containing protein
MCSLAERGGAPSEGQRAGISTHHHARRGLATRSRARSGCSSGFSLVELLVTIVLAGIVFAALVPVFVSAQKASSGDKARNVANNIAQDRIEKIRLLGFDQIVDDASHLQSSSFAGGQFGTSFTPAGSSKSYSVAYSVDNVPSTGAVNYKRVSVTVSWTAPPSPVRPVSMTTIVMNPAGTSASSSASPSPSSSASPSPSPSPTSAATYSLTILVTNNYVNSSSGVTVVRTDVTPNVTATPSMLVPTTSVPSVWSGLAPGTYLVTCNYYKNGNTGNQKTLTQTVYVTTSNQSYTFTL